MPTQEVTNTWTPPQPNVDMAGDTNKPAADSSPTIGTAHRAPDADNPCTATPPKTTTAHHSKPTTPKTSSTTDQATLTGSYAAHATDAEEQDTTNAYNPHKHPHTTHKPTQQLGMALNSTNPQNLRGVPNLTRPRRHDSQDFLQGHQKLRIWMGLRRRYDLG